ncbi:MAG: hypothetical protein JKY65_33505 [Planctomycetes bacterium]|nr:hypothetical protein [Planctomycetota bacterium]
MPAIEMNTTDPNNGNAARIRSKNFSNRERDEYLRAQKDAFYGQLQGVGFNTNALVASDTKTSGIVTVKFYKSGSPSPNYSKIKSATKKALEWLAGDPALTFPNNELSIFIAEESDLSLGYFYKDGFVEKASIALGKTAVQDVANAMNVTVSTEVKAHYSSAITISSQTRRIMTIVVHEMGHLFHQQNDLWKYKTLGNLQMIGAQGVSEEAVRHGMDATPDKVAELNGATAAAIYKFILNTRYAGKCVSMYAYSGGLNELVAEVFSALIMGSPIGGDNGNTSEYLDPPFPTYAQILAMYAELGGAVPAAGAMHVRK